MNPLAVQFALTPLGIIRQVAAETGVSVDNIRSPRRWASVVAARRLCAVRLRAAGLSYAEIGRVLRRDRTSVMWLCGALLESRVARFAAMEAKGTA